MGSRSSVERAVELCKEHREDLEKYLSAPPRGTRHTLKAFESFAAYQRSKTHSGSPRT
jgi:hypothetical protein